MSREFFTLTPLFSVRFKNLWMDKTDKNNIYIKFLNFICILQKSKRTCQKSETWFFSLMCQEAIPILIDFFHFFFGWPGLKFTEAYTFEKACNSETH